MPLLPCGGVRRHRSDTVGGHLVRRPTGAGGLGPAAESSANGFAI